MKALIIILVVQLLTGIAIKQLLPTYLSLNIRRQNYGDLKEVYKSMMLVRHVPIISQAMLLMIFTIVIIESK